MYKMIWSLLPVFSLILSPMISWRIQPVANIATCGQSMSTNVQNALSILQQYPIEGDLRSMDQLAERFSTSLIALEDANSIIQVTQSIKDIPGAWSGLIIVLNSVTPGLGTSLENLDSNLRLIISIKDDLDELTNLDQLAETIALFTASPSDSNLTFLKIEINDQFNKLASLQTKLSNQFKEVDRTILDIENIRSAISQKAKELIVINGVTQNISKLNTTLSNIQALVRITSTKLQDFLNPLNRIVGVLDAIRNDSSKVNIQTVQGVAAPSPNRQTSTSAYYYPLAECNGSYLRIGDYVTVNIGSGSQGIRSTPDTHPSNNIIARVPEGGGITIVGGPKCNYGWILWQVKTDTGVYGWTPESNGSTQWLVSPSINLSSPKPRPWYHPISGCAGSYLAIGDHVTVIYGTGAQTIRSTADVSYDANNKIGQVPEGTALTIISGPKCSLGWILWEVKTDSGLVGWTAEGNTIQEWLQFQSGAN